jgi:hypothetical protein
VSVDVTNSGTVVFALAGGQSFANAISGTGAVTVLGISGQSQGANGPTGSLTLSGANTYAGTTTVSDAAALTLDFSAAGAPSDNIINNGRTSANVAAGSGSALVIGSTTGGSSTGGSMLTVIGTTSSQATNTQDFRGLTVNAGAASVAVAAAAGHTATLNLNGITRAGVRGTVDFAPSGAGTAVITTTTANTPAGILSG